MGTWPPWLTVWFRTLGSLFSQCFWEGYHLLPVRSLLFFRSFHLMLTLWPSDVSLRSTCCLFSVEVAGVCQPRTRWDGPLRIAVETQPSAQLQNPRNLWLPHVSISTWHLKLPALKLNPFIVPFPFPLPELCSSPPLLFQSYLDPVHSWLLHSPLPSVPALGGSRSRRSSTCQACPLETGQITLWPQFFPGSQLFWPVIVWSLWKTERGFLSVVQACLSGRLLGSAPNSPYSRSTPLPSSSHWWTLPQALVLRVTFLTQPTPALP